jgi:hypothetical protein
MADRGGTVVKVAGSIPAGVSGFFIDIKSFRSHYDLGFELSPCVYSEELLNVNRGNCPKHVEFHSKNKFEKLVHLVGITIGIYRDARSPESQMRLEQMPDK